MSGLVTGSARASGPAVGKLPRTIAVLTHVEHFTQGGRLHAYGPYAREIELWADLFESVLIIAPCLPGPPGPSSRGRAPISTRRRSWNEHKPETAGLAKRSSAATSRP